jgi:ethanolamine kinase
LIFICFSIAPDGKVYEPADIRGERDPGTVAAIARKLARFHATDLAAFADDTSGGDPEAGFKSMLASFIAQAPRSFPEDPARDAAVRALRLEERVIPEAAALVASLDAGELGATVLCHNDLLPGNIVERPSGKVAFIDFEYCCPNARGFDIGNHFAERCGMTCEYEAHFPRSVDAMRGFLEAYAAEYTLVAGVSGEGESAAPLTVEQLAQEAWRGALLSHFFWGMWGLVQAKVSDIDFDYVAYAKMRFEAYFTWKERSLVE